MCARIKKVLVFSCGNGCRLSPTAAAHLAVANAKLMRKGIMTAMGAQIRLSPVYSRLAAVDEVAALQLADKLPVDAAGKPWRLSKHQVATYRALTAKNGPDVLFNIAITGDGKSLAGQLPSLQDGWRRKLFAMYPTNELIRDQQRQAQATWQLWGQYPLIASLDSHELDKRMETGDFEQRSAALSAVLKNHDVVLTNPDIFHYVMQSFYVYAGKGGDAADKVFAPLINTFQQFTFDEFHIFEAPQIVSVVTALLLIQEVAKTQRRQFLFQSATPNPLMLHYLERAELTVDVIRGEYAHCETNPNVQDWRLILRGCDLHFAAGSVEQWMDEHLDDVLLPFMLGHRPGAKGAIIVNSVAQAKRLVQRLQGTLERHGIRVGENTGMTGRSRRAASYECDLLVGTSTIDVGVDFQINFLLFESRDAGTFLQRLGRLGRHSGYQTKSGAQVSFQDHFVAYALVPSWVEEALFVGRGTAGLLLSPGSEIDRDSLTAAIQTAFPPVTNFENYAREWGILQATRVVSKLSERLVRDQYEPVRKSLIQRYSAAFGTSVIKQRERHSALQQDQRKLYDEVTSFRGGSSFVCGVLDASEEGAEQVKTYDLFSLIANAHLDELEETEFWAAVQRWGITEQPLRRQNLVAFFRLRGFASERSNFWIGLRHDVGEWDSVQFGTAQLFDGIQLKSEYPQSIPSFNAINRRLLQRAVPALVCLRLHPLELKRQLRLPLLFAVHKLETRDGFDGCIAFDREALLLHTALQRQHIDCGGSALFV
jgi:CRISPR-associated endonuclease/helicase Cas3